MACHLVRGGGQGVEIGLEVEEVLDRHPGIGCVGEGRVVVRALGRDAVAHRLDEGGLAPAADAGVRVRADVRHAEIAERCLEHEAARQRQLGLALGVGCRMAGAAAADPEQLFAIGEIGLVRWQVDGGVFLRCREVPEAGAGRRDEGQRRDEEAFERHQLRETRYVS